MIVLVWIKFKGICPVKGSYPGLKEGRTIPGNFHDLAFFSVADQYMIVVENLDTSHGPGHKIKIMGPYGFNRHRIRIHTKLVDPGKFTSRSFFTVVVKDDVTFAGESWHVLDIRPVMVRVAGGIEVLGSQQVGLPICPPVIVVPEDPPDASCLVINLGYETLQFG
jgi:hypothetical protein